MRKSILVVLLLILLLSLPVSASELGDVKSAGVLRFGTAPDYVPFVFYDENDQLSGIDVALMNEIGRRMGVKVESINLAFDGLIDSLNVDQVDVIGGAFSKNESRENLIDFTRVYYKGEGQIISRVNENTPAQVSFDSFRGRKIGVMKGTSFDQWVKTNMVGGGYIGTRDVYTYSEAGSMIASLDRGTVDFVVMDGDVYHDRYSASGKYKIFYKDFITENYAFGVRKGSDLAGEINNVLKEMILDGTAQDIANRFFGKNYGEADVTLVRPAQAATVAPLPVIPTAQPYNPQPVSCVNSMSFVSDVTIKDGHQVSPGEHFTKIWRVYNNGSCTWDPSYSFTFVSGDQMNGRNISIPRIVAPGQTVDLAVDMSAPHNEGTYKGYWQMRSPYGQNFGQTIWAKVRVRGNAPQPTQRPNPTQRPYPTDVPILPPTINYFNPDYYSGYEWDCPTIYWSTNHSQIVEISIDGVSQYKGENASGQFTYCPPFQSVGSHYVELYAFNITDDARASFTYTTKREEPVKPVYPTAVPEIDPVYPTAVPEIDPVYPDKPVVYEEDTNYLDDLVIPDDWVPPTDEEIAAYTFGG